MMVGGDEGFELQDDIQIDIDFPDVFYRVQESTATRYRVDDNGTSATIQVVGIPGFMDRGTQEQGGADQMSLTVQCATLANPAGDLLTPSP